MECKDNEERHDLRKHQMMMLDMLGEVDAICKKHGIRYMLFAGTALGAARHGGFIPWDDDMDVIMLRPEYEKFLAAADKELDKEKYFLQKEFSEHWPMFFSKIRMNGTACMEKFRPKDARMHQGIYIDIFPCDNLADNEMKRKMQFAASKMVIANSLYKRGYLTNSTVKKLVMQASRFAPVRALHSFALNRGDDGSEMLHSFFGASSKYGRSIYRREWMTELAEARFEGKTFPVSAHYDELLTALYGDWRRIPTPEERKCKVHGALVDLNRSYEEYLERQKTMKIDVLSRSIR